MNKVNMKWEKLILFSVITMCCIVILGQTSCSSFLTEEASDLPGRVAFLWSPEVGPNNPLKLILIDGNGNSPRYLGSFSGSIAFSKDGSLIAAGCPPLYGGAVTELCIIDIKQFAESRDQIPVGIFGSTSYISTRVSLPDQCIKYQYKKGEIYEGILSLDWSPRSDKLIIVCGKPHEQEVCILPLNDDSYCWDEENSNEVVRAVWSPVDESRIATSAWDYKTSLINLVDSEGNILNYVASGVNPEWSPEGDQIAYIEKYNDPNNSAELQGIAVVASDGSNHKWLYKPNILEKNNLIHLDGINSGWPVRLAWSPDGHYIAFSGTHVGMFNFGIFRLDIKTGNVNFLVDQGIFKNIVTEPDWAP